MADIIYRFDNTPFGGNFNVTIGVNEMPDFHPIGEEVKENVYNGNRGKIWRYQWYRKQAIGLAFNGVGALLAATMGSIAIEHVAFLWYKDLNNAGGTGTMMYLGEFEQSPVSPNVTDFGFPMVDAE